LNNEGENLIEVTNLTKSFLVDKKRIEILKNINFTLPDTGLFYLLGESGSGKSTLLNILEGLVNFDKGKVMIDKKDISELKKTRSFYKDKIGIIFQSFNLVDDLNGEENLKIIRKKINPKYSSIIENLKIKDLLKKKCYLLSGGEKQRLCLYRVLLNDPQIILGDEILAQVDEKNKKMIMSELYSLSKDKLIVLATHNLDLINEFKGETLVLNKNKGITFEGNIKSST